MWENEQNIIKRERDPIPPTKAWTHFARNTYSNDDHVFKRWSRTNHPKRGKNPYTAPLREFHRRCSRRDDIHVRGGPVRARDERFQYFSHLCWRKRWKMWSVLGYRSLSKCVITWSYSSDSDSITCNSRARIANHLVKGSCCRGGIVNIRCGRSCALLVQPQSTKALWRFRASTSNSPSGRTWPHTHTPIRYIYQTYAQQDIRVCGDDHFEPPNRQYHNPKALWLLRVSIWVPRDDRFWQRIYTQSNW